MAFDFAGNANCVALYNFESGALTTDSKGTNTLTEYHSGTATQASSTHKQGSYSADLENSYDNQFYRTDANLSAGFPLKSGTTNKVFSIVCWFRLESFVGTNYNYICSKNDIGANKRSFLLAVRNNTGQVNSINALFGRSSGTTNETIVLFQNLSVGRWYHLAFTYDDSTKIWYCRLWDDTDKLYREKYGIASAAIEIYDAPFQIGGVQSSGTPTGDYSFDGLIDQFAVFNDLLTIAEIDQIRTDNYSGASAYTQLYGSSLDSETEATILTKLQALCTRGGGSWSYTVFGTSERDLNVGGAIINGASYTKTVFIMGSIHGTETGGDRVALDFLNYLCANAAEIISGVRYIVIPIINPDGRAANTRKNNNNLHDDSVVPFPRSVDLNRNFTFYRGAGDASSDSSNRKYMGPAALSEAESQIIDSVLDDYAPGLFFDCHTKENYIGVMDDFILKRKSVLDSAMDALSLTKFSWDASSLQGEAMNDAAQVYGAESYLIEGATIGPDQMEVNRGICALKTIIEEWDSDDVPPVHNNFASDASCVANYRFLPKAITEDEQGKNDLTGTNFPQTTVNLYVPIGHIMDCGSTSGYLGNQTNGYMSIADASLSSDFPQKSGGTKKDLSYCLFFKIRDLDKFAGTQYIIAKYDTNDKRSWALIWATADSKLYAYSGHTNGTDREAVSISPDVLVENKTYFVAFTYKNSTKAWTARLVDAETDEVLFDSGGTFANEMSTTDAALMLGAAMVPTLFVQDVSVGAVQIFNEVLSSTRIDEIYADTVTAGTAPPSELRQGREDISGNNRDLTDSGVDATGNTAGKIGNAAYFSGEAQQLLTLASAPDLSTNPNFTIAFKAKIHAPSAPGSDISWKITIGTFEIEVGFKSGQTSGFASASSPSLSVSTGNTLAQDVWITIFVFYDGSNLSIAIDNSTIDQDAGANLGIASPAASLSMGFAAGVAMTAYIDEVGIWLGANSLSADQRTILYSGNYGQRPEFA